MAEVTITLNDTLQDRIDCTISQVETAITDWLENNTDFDPEFDNLSLESDLNYGGNIDNIVRSAVPIYTGEIKTIWFLHGSDLEQAYENAGTGDNPLDNYGMAAIYFYIQEQISEWFGENSEDIISEFFQEKVDTAWKEVKDAFEAWQLQDFDNDDLEGLDLYDLGFSSDFAWVTEQAESRLEELKADI